jgi:hypothetical protein
MLLTQRGGKVPVLDPVANMGIKDEGFKKLVKVRSVWQPAFARAVLM